MPEVCIERDMQGVDPAAAWRVASDLLRYPSFMNSVVSIAEVEDSAGRQVTAWKVLFNGNELEWIEHDRYDLERMSLEFEQLDGDLADWRGRLKIIATETGAIGRYEIYFDLGIPALAATLHPLGEQVIRANCEQMLSEIERRATPGAERALQNAGRT